MAKTKIEWTESVWNPIRGCSRVSEGCRNCYAERVAMRFSGPGEPYEGLVQITNGHPQWTGTVRFVGEHLEDPLHWKKPRRIFVNSMSDLFHEEISARGIDSIFQVMAAARWHTFQVLTKRAKRMLGLLQCLEKIRGAGWVQRVLPHVWWGVSVESQKHKDRIDLLRETPAAVRMLSLEPLLGDLGELDLRGIHWVIVGGESGPGARPMHPDWVRHIRDQCICADVPFFFKQWGEWGGGFGRPSGTPGRFAIVPPDRPAITVDRYPRSMDSFGSAVVERVGKKAAGRLLDGREWNEYPYRHRILYPEVKHG